MPNWFPEGSVPDNFSDAVLGGALISKGQAPSESMVEGSRELGGDIGEGLQAAGGTTTLPTGGLEFTGGRVIPEGFVTGDLGSGGGDGGFLELGLIERLLIALALIGTFLVFLNAFAGGLGEGVAS